MPYLYHYLFASIPWVHCLCGPGCFRNSEAPFQGSQSCSGVFTLAICTIGCQIIKYKALYSFIMHGRILPGESGVLMFREQQVTKLLCFCIVFRPYMRLYLSVISKSYNRKLSPPLFLKAMEKTADQG